MNSTRLSDNRQEPALPPRQPGKRSKLYAEVARAIVRLITDDGLAPGDRLPGELALAHRLAISRASLREAFVALEMAGVIEMRANTGAFVLQADGRDLDRIFGADLAARASLREVTALRILIESEGARLSIANGGVSWESALVAAHHRLAHVETRMQQGDLSLFGLWRQCDWQFHEALLSASGSQLHRSLHQALFGRFQQVVTLEFQGQGFRGGDIVTEHRSILDSALARDASACSKSLTRHLSMYFRTTGDKPKTEARACKSD